MNTDYAIYILLFISLYLNVRLAIANHRNLLAYDALYRNYVEDEQSDAQ